jgi:biopolymer transport protein ExbD
MAKRVLRALRKQDPPDLDITAFMNLMVALVPFLLVTAVFSRISILQLDLPVGVGAEQIDEKKVTIEVIVRSDSIEIGDGAQIVMRIPNKEREEVQEEVQEEVEDRVVSVEEEFTPYDVETLSNVLREIKANYPDKTDATVLMEPDLEYDVLVKIMDTVSTVGVPDEAGKIKRYELFPEISVGDAPGSGV